MLSHAQRRYFDLCHTINHIMTGPNPLTASEMRKLIEKRPGVYWVLKAWADRLEKEA